MSQHIPQSERLNISFFGRCNSGKSSLINAIAGQAVAIVANIPGTTTDTVQKSIELPGIGACVLTDTAGIDDTSELGKQRIEQTKKAIERTDIAILVMDVHQTEWTVEQEWLTLLRKKNIAIIGAMNKTDMAANSNTDIAAQTLGITVYALSALRHNGIEEFLQGLRRATEQHDTIEDITGNLAQAGDVVVLVMPQDKEAPKGRLILPQVQTIRNLLDKSCIPICCTPETLKATLQTVAAPPHLIITDSQAFASVEPLCPKETLLTSFSILFARYKGDIRAFAEGANQLRRLAPNARILIAEACSHIPQNEDIGRVKLPRLLRKRFGEALHIDIVSGNDFPQDLTGYDLIIHCGACMFTQRHVLNRLAQAQMQSVPMTNYGIALAALTGILDKVALPQ